MKKRNLSFAIAMSITASLNVPEDVWALALKDTKEALQAIKDDVDGELWGAAVSGQHNIDESSYHILSSALEDAKGDVDAAAEDAIIRAISKGLRKETKTNMEREDLTHVQVTFSMTPKSDTIINQTKKED